MFLLWIYVDWKTCFRCGHFNTISFLNECQTTMFKAIYFEKSTEIMIPWLNDCHIHIQLYMLFKGNSKNKIWCFCDERMKVWFSSPKLVMRRPVGDRSYKKYWNPRYSDVLNDCHIHVELYLQVHSNITAVLHP